MYMYALRWRRRLFRNDLSLHVLLVFVAAVFRCLCSKLSFGRSSRTLNLYFCIKTKTLTREFNSKTMSKQERNCRKKSCWKKKKERLPDDNLDLGLFFSHMYSRLYATCSHPPSSHPSHIVRGLRNNLQVSLCLQPSTRDWISSVTVVRNDDDAAHIALASSHLSAKKTYIQWGRNCTRLG